MEDKNNQAPNTAGIVSDKARHGPQKASQEVLLRLARLSPCATWKWVLSGGSDRSVNGANVNHCSSAPRDTMGNHGLPMPDTRLVKFFLIGFIFSTKEKKSTKAEIHHSKDNNPAAIH